MNKNSVTIHAEEDPLSIYLQPSYSEISFKPNIEQSLPQTVQQQSISHYNVSPINEITIKEKLQKINSSIYSVFLTEKAKVLFQSITSCILESLSTSSFSNQINLALIDYFFSLLIELICQIKEEMNAKETIIEKLNTIIKTKKDTDRKYIEIKRNLKSKQRELNLQFNTSQLEKEKNNFNRKSINNELNDFKIDNKKLLSQIELYKNELRKKDINYNKIQEKLKALLTKGSALQCKNNPEVLSSLHLKNNNEFYSEANELLNNTIERSNMNKIREITDLNCELMSLLKIIHSYLMRIYANANEKKIELKGEKKMITLQDDMFTIHLIHPQVMSEFCISFLNNMTYIDEMMNALIEKLIGFKKQKNLVKKNEHFEEAYKSISKQYDNDIKNKDCTNYFINKGNHNDNKNISDSKNEKKWYENITNKKVFYSNNEEDILKCDKVNDKDNIDI